MERIKSESNSSSSSTSSSTIVGTGQRRDFKGIRIESPFTLKVGQVFTGFGIGCGIGIGVGRPINLGAVPMVGEVMTAARGATDAFAGASRHLNNALRKVGAKNIEAGVGCGIGFGHGFGAGLAVKPGVVHQIQSSIAEAVAKLMMKFGGPPSLPIVPGASPLSMQTAVATTREYSTQNPLGSLLQTVPKVSENTSRSLPEHGSVGAESVHRDYASKSSLNPSFGTRTEEVLNSFLQNPLLKDEGTSLNQLGERLQSENKLLQMVLKHQQIIDDLMMENEKLRQVLVEDLKIPASKLQAPHTSKSLSPCSECFECRRKLRKSR